MKQITEAEAIAIHDSKAWEAWTPMQRAAFQMVQDRLCMPFTVFHQSVEAALGRSVWTHEFGLNREGLQRELAGQKSAPSMDEIIGLIPADKLVVVATGAAP